MKPDDLHKLPPIARANAMHTPLPVNRRAHLVALVVASAIIAALLGYAFLWPDEVRTVTRPVAQPGIIYFDTRAAAASVPGESVPPPTAQSPDAEQVP